MRDNVRSFMGEKEKRAGNGTRKEFYKESEFQIPRFEFQWSDRSRVCVCYSHLVRFEYFPKADADGQEVIVIDLPGQIRMSIAGFGLEKIYDLLKEDRLSWVREADLDEKHEGQDLYVSRVGEMVIFDWKTDLEVIEGQREAIFGNRRYDKPELAE